MMELESAVQASRRAKQALQLWGVFFVLAIILNGTVPFVLGIDVHAWTQSTTKSFLFSLIIYGGLFLTAPLVNIKGWGRVRQRDFFLPLLAAIAGVTLWSFVRGIATVAILSLAYLHWRFDLSDYGIRTRGWRGDLAAALLLGLFSLIPVLLRTRAMSFTLTTASIASFDRLFANPASSVENLFYFGFLAERLSTKTGKWITPVLIGLMYTAHEMTNPAYWYSGMNFVFVFFGIAFTTWIYLWRRGVTAIWFGDGLARFFTRLF